jgi:superfamily I DNA/RNA helicase
LEWPVVYHLEPQLIPSKHCTTEEEFQQERNLRYVIETRTKDKLYSVQQEGLR